MSGTESSVGWVVKKGLTRERIEEHRKRLGSDFTNVKTLRPVNLHGRCILDAVMRFSDNIGDLNPLYHDPEYGKKTRYGALVAHPAFVISIHPGQTMQGLPGVHLAVAGNTWNFKYPILEKDTVVPRMIFSDIEEKSSSFRDLFLIEHMDTTFTNQLGQIVVRQDGRMLRYDRDDTKDGLERRQRARSEQMPPKRTEEEILAIEDAQLNEPIRGAEPRYWEDVSVGESLPDLMRGPFSFGDFITQLTTFDVWKGHSRLIQDLRKHPGYAWIHPLSAAREHIEIIHSDIHIAHKNGYAYPYDSGHVRGTFIITQMTNWMGDEGWLKMARADARKFVYISDVITVKSKISKKYVDEAGEHCVDIEANMWNNRDEVVMPGEATIVLPSREQGTWPVQKRLDERKKVQAAK